MRIQDYTTIYLRELWSTEDKLWKIVDRTLLLTSVLTAIVLFVVPRFQQGGNAIMSMLAWLIPLGIWVLFVLTIVPYRLVSKYHRKHQATIDQLVTVWVSGNKLKTEIYAEYKQVKEDDIKERCTQWTQSVVGVFLANPHQLGLTKLISLEAENKDAADIPLPQVMRKNDLITGYYINLAVQISKINHIIQDLSKDKG